MNTLRAKLTALLVAAILLVVLLATGLTFLLVSPPRFEAAEDATATQLALIVDLIANRPEATAVASGDFIGVKAAAAGGRVAEGPTRGLNAALKRKGRSEQVIVSDPPGARWPVISARLGDGRWLLMPMSMAPPPDNRGWALAGWMLIFALGTTAVMVVAVRRLTEPLALLERTVAAIGPDGELAPLPEQGPTEVRAAARAVNLLSSRLKTAMESRIRLVAAAGHDLRTPMTRMRLRAEFLDDHERDTWIADLDELDRIADSAIRLVREEVEDSSRTPIRLDQSGARRDGRDRRDRHESRPRLPFPGDRAVPPALAEAGDTQPRHQRGDPRPRSDGPRCDRGGPCRGGDRGSRPGDSGGTAGPCVRAVLPGRGRPRRTDPGAGLGLAIAHEIVSRNGGSLTLRNRAEGGLEQWVTFPIAADRPAAPI